MSVSERSTIPTFARGAGRDTPAATVRLADLRLPRLRRWPTSAAPPTACRRRSPPIGLPLDVISGADLARDLSRYDVIVVGPRAFETDPDPAGHNDRLLAYARGGGTVIVQYQQYGYFLGQLRAVPADRGQPAARGAEQRYDRDHPRARVQRRSPALLGGHDRVTDETAPVTVVDPEKPAPAYAEPDRAGATGMAGCRSADSTSRRPGTPAWKPVARDA